MSMHFCHYTPLPYYITVLTCLSSTFRLAPCFVYSLFHCYITLSIPVLISSAFMYCYDKPDKQFSANPPVQIQTKLSKNTSTTIYI